jgi:hypothetical protein
MFRAARRRPVCRKKRIMSNNHRVSPTGRKAGYRRTVTVATGSLVTQSVTVVTAALTGLATTDVVCVNPTTTLAAGVGVAYAMCAAANVLSVAFINPTAATIATSNASLRVDVRKYTA